MAQRSPLSFLWQHIKPYKWYYAMMLVPPLLSGSFWLISSHAIRCFVDLVGTCADLTYRDFAWPLGLILGTHLLIILGWNFSHILERKVAPKVRTSILLDSYNYIQHHSYWFFRKNFSGVVNAKIKGLIDGYDRIWVGIHHAILYKGLRIFLCMGGLLLLNRTLGIFMLLWSLVFTCIMFSIFNGKHRKIVREQSDSSQQALGSIADRTTNIDTILAFAARKREMKLLQKELKEDYIPKQSNYHGSRLIIECIGGMLYLIGSATALCFVIYAIKHKLIDAGGVSYMLGLLLGIFATLWSLLESLTDLIGRAGALKSAMSVLEEAQEELDAPDAKPLKVKKAAISFQDLSFGYRNRAGNLFENFNLTIRPGEKVGLVGSSGAGKSSLIALLFRYFSRYEGNILIDGQDIRGVTQQSLRRQIAVVAQDTTLFHRSIRDNIMYGKPEATEEEMIVACKNARMHDEIMALPAGYESSVGERGSMLSGGQKQRVAIARALLKDAPIFILDEASSALDSQTEKEIQKALYSFMQDKRKTLIAIAHRLSTLQNMDRLLVLEKGRIVEEGTHASLLAQEGSRYKKLWEHQSMGTSL